MTFPQCVHQWFEAIVREAVQRRVEQCLPCPDNTPVGVFLDKVQIVELTQEYPEMAMKEMSVTLAGDAPFGYLVTGLVFANRAGGVVDPAPGKDDVEVTTSAGMVASGRYLGNGEMLVITQDSAAPGSTADITISASATGTEDDAIIHVTLGNDRVGVVDVAGLTFTELAAPIDPPAPPADPVPPEPVDTAPPADPAPPAEPTP